MKNRKILSAHLIGLIISLIFLSGCDNQKVKLVSLKVEMQENPIGIGTPNPRFSWQITSVKPDLQQKSYQIQVALSEENLKNEENLIWDSGIIEDDKSVLIPFKGEELKSGLKYYWRLRVSTNQGDTDWSKINTWSMALLNESDWKAKWIGEDSMSNPGETDKGNTRLAARYLRKPFTLKNNIERAVLYISGQGVYEAYINGEKISEDVLSPTVSWYPDRVYYNVYDVTPLLKRNDNILGVILGNGRYFPSVSGSWLLSNEEFLKDSDLISFLKLRASYGVTGNSNIGSFRYLSTFSLNSTYQDLVGATPERSGNPYLGWETAYMSGLGVDINFGNRIELNFDLYNIDNKDLLLAVPKKPSTGFFEGMENIGSVRNQGVEVQLNTRNIITPDFTWNTMFNIGFNKNRVTETPNNEPFLLTRNMIYQEVKPGQDIFSWYMPKWVGVDPENGDPLWEKITRNENGDITERTTTNDYTQAAPQVMGKATPKFSGGFINNFTYKRFSLNVNTNYVYGNKIYNYNRMSSDGDGAYLGYNQMSIENSKLGWNRWREPGDIATHPKAVTNCLQQSE